jgi:hypothetical protein
MTEPVDPLEELPAVDVDALLLHVKQLEGDIESWKVTVEVLLAELIICELPYGKLSAVIEKVYSKVQSHLHWGHSSGHKGAIVMNQPLIDMLIRAASWRRMARDHKERTGEFKW